MRDGAVFGASGRGDEYVGAGAGRAGAGAAAVATGAGAGVGASGALAACLWQPVNANAASNNTIEMCFSGIDFMRASFCGRAPCRASLSSEDEGAYA